MFACLHVPFLHCFICSLCLLFSVLNYTAAAVTVMFNYSIFSHTNNNRQLPVCYFIACALRVKESESSEKKWMCFHMFRTHIPCKVCRSFDHLRYACARVYSNCVIYLFILFFAWLVEFPLFRCRSLLCAPRTYIRTSGPLCHFVQRKRQGNNKTINRHHIWFCLNKKCRFSIFRRSTTNTASAAANFFFIVNLLPLLCRICLQLRFPTSHHHKQ